MAGILCRRDRIETGPLCRKPPAQQAGGGHAHVLCGLDLEASVRMGAVIDDDLKPRAGEMLVGDLRNPLAQGTDLLAGDGQALSAQIGIGALEVGLGTEALRRDAACGGEDMDMMVADIGHAMGRMDGVIDGHAEALDDIGCEVAGQGEALRGVELMRESDLEFAGGAGVAAGLCGLCGIPHGSPVQRPIGGPLQGCGQDDLGMDHTCLAAEVMGDAIALVHEADGCTIGGGCDGGSACGSGDGFD